jgi:uncharacterized protein YjiS (DUF1127 family)
MMIKDPRSSLRSFREGRMARADCEIASRCACWQYLQILIRDLLFRSHRPLMHSAWLIRPIQWVQHKLRSRAGERALMELDDRALHDIGLTRSNIHAAAYGLLDPERAIESTSIEPPRSAAVPRGRHAASVTNATEFRIPEITMQRYRCSL